MTTRPRCGSRVAGYGLEAISLSGHSDLTTRDGLEHGIRAVRWAAAYGLPIVNTAVGGHQSADENEAAFLANVAELADAAEDASVVVALEIHGDIMASSDVTIPLIEKIGRESVRVNYDTANVEFYSGDLAVDDLPKITRVPRSRPSEGDDRRQGQLELPGDRRRARSTSAACSRFSSEAGYSGPYSVEIEFEGEPWPAAGRRQRRDAALVRAPEQRSGWSSAMARSLYMPEMTNLQVREYLEGGGRTVIVPVGSTEDHGDHGPLWTDVYIPLEVAKRAAPELDALVGPPIPFGLAADHRGAHGLVHVRHGHVPGARARRLPVARRRRLPRIVLLNGHYCNSQALEFASSRDSRRAARGDADLPVPVLGGAAAGGGRAVPVGTVGIHANVGETSIVLAIDQSLCDMERVARLRPRAARAAHERVSR